MFCGAPAEFNTFCITVCFLSGISMSLLESKNGLQYFTFEHNRDYQQVQFKFLDAVESMDPNNIVVSRQSLKMPLNVTPTHCFLIIAVNFIFCWRPLIVSILHLNYIYFYAFSTCLYSNLHLTYICQL